MKFSKRHGISRTQAELDFVDIDTNADIPLYFDPSTFSNGSDIWSISCNNSVVSFFQTVLDCLHRKDIAEGYRLFEYLGEPNETCLGVSKGKPRGRSVGKVQSRQIFEQLASSAAAKSGQLSDLADCGLYVVGIGPDKLSDITTNIIRAHLIEYTQNQCALHGVTELQNVPAGSTWDAMNRQWRQSYADLPTVSGKVILLVPKRFVRWKGDLSSNHRQYYKHFVLNFLKDENLRLDTSLVHVLKKGGRRVYKTELSEKYPLSKDFLFRFSRDNPEVLERYKNAYKKHRPLSSGEIDKEFSATALAEALIDQLRSIPAGKESAYAFHNLMVGVLEFLFYPDLTCPQKETALHDGRKKIDITFMNTAESGFFFKLHSQHEITSMMVMIECKNYVSDPGNPEFDQLAQRFGPNRGKFGFLIARRFEDVELATKRCRDTCRDGRGWMLPMEDKDIVALLEMVGAGKRVSLNEYLFDKFRNILL